MSRAAMAISSLVQDASATKLILTSIDRWHALVVLIARHPFNIGTRKRL